MSFISVAEAWRLSRKNGYELAKDKPVSGGNMATPTVNQPERFVAADKTFGNLSSVVADALEQEAVTTTYPTGAVLFAEGQTPRGEWIVRRGRGTLSMSGSHSRT